MPEHVHVFAVDASLTEDEAWAELCALGRRQTNTGSHRYAVRRCNGNECWRIATAAQAEARSEREGYRARSKQ